jgi:hypothetical protein
MSIQSKRDKLHYTDDNLKYLKGHVRKGSTLQKQRVMILNQGSAHECPSRKLGLCQLPDHKKCYAYQQEKRYSASLPFKNCQKRQWERLTAREFVKRISVIQVGKNRKFTHMRFAESSDFRGAWDVVKLYHIAEGLRSHCKMETFVYTARSDIFSGVLVKALSVKFPSLVVNGSGFMVHNEYRVVSADYKPKHKKEVWCKGKCHICRLCKVRGGFTILTVCRDGKYKAEQRRLRVEQKKAILQSIV